VEANRHLKIAKERITIARRDVRKLISAAVEDGVPGNWGQVEEVYIVAMSRLRRAKTLEELTGILDELELLREEVVNLLESHINLEDSDTNDRGSRQHIQNSNTDSINELEPRSEKEQGARSNKFNERSAEPIKAFPLGMVLRACPEISAYGQGGSIGSWRDLMTAAVVVRSMLDVSPSAYQDACEAMGPENAAVAMAAILERAGHITSAGGYLRDLTSRARRGEFSLGPMLMALLRARGGEATVAMG
jgi:replication initiation protein RepC